MKKKKIKAKKITRKKVKKSPKKTKRLKKTKISQEQIYTLLRKGEERGFLTSSEILYSIPNIEHNIEELEKMYDLLKERGIELREVREFLEVKGKKEKKAKKAILGKIDPIQMYLKEIGKSHFLTAKEEKELAKRIERGEEAYI